MRYWLATEMDQARWSTIERFDPRYWTINFPTPMLASINSYGNDGLDVMASFARRNDLAGIIWTSQDLYSHPLLRYETQRDYRGLKLSFRWESAGRIMPLDAVNGPTLTIEGRDATGAPRSWYVRLWNYASGSSSNATIALDFDHLDGGFLLPAEADPVYAGDIDRMFISLVPDSYDPASTDPIGTSPVDGFVTLHDLRCTGPTAMLEIGDARIPPHDLRMAGGYDDAYHLVPERIVRQMFALGYRGRVDHYVGMAHYPSLRWDSGEARFVATNGQLSIAAAAIHWHSGFFRALAQFGFDISLSLSFELLNSLCPENWKQRAHDGTPALTGWSPPSTLLSPCNSDAMAFLKKTALDFMSIAAGSGLSPHFQMGEPWWWCPSAAPRKPCFHDSATTAAYAQETGLAAPPITSVLQTPTPAQANYCTWLGQKLAAATASICAEAKRAASNVQCHVLVYAPQLLGSGEAMLLPANLPVAWAYPAFDSLQFEDYDYVIAGNTSAHEQAFAAVQARLGYPLAKTDYFTGFVQQPGNPALWRQMMQFARLRGDVRDIYVWAYPQIMRDGFTTFATEDSVDGFHDVQFPLALGLRASGGPVFSTTVTESASGHESRNINWAQARRRYDAAPGIRSQADLALLLEFFEARRGRAYGFRYRDPLDHSSARLDDPVSAQDQQLGIGDGQRTSFALIKQYGDAIRRISRPDPASVVVALDGVRALTGWSLGVGGMLHFATAPANGRIVTAGFLFDVPVRFETDDLSLSLAAWRAGEIRSVAMVEVRDETA